MLSNMWKAVVVTTAVLSFGASIACAQTTLAGSVYGAFGSSTSGNQTTQSPSKSAGVLLELRHTWNPLMGVEVTYSYRRDDESYSKLLLIPGQTDTVTASIPANAHEVTADWVGSFRLANLRPFVLAGGGLLLDVPASGNVTATGIICNPPGTTNACAPVTGNITISTRSQTKGVFQYGAGVDWTVLPHIGLRFQYRGNVYKAASLAQEFTSTNKFTQDSEPMVGVFFQF